MYPLTLATAIETKELWEEVQAALQDLPVRVLIEQQDTADLAAFVERIERMRPEVVLLDVTRLEDSLDESVRRIKAASSQPMVMALHTSSDPETILSAVRAGANEYLYPPLCANLRKALERKAGERSRNRDALRQAGKTLGFFSAKGGCGATTLACHVAAELGRIGAPLNRPTLLADLDLEAGMVGFLMKVVSPYSVRDAVENLHRLDLSYWKALVTNGRPGLEIIAGPPGFAARNPAPYEKLREVLAFARAQYDWSVVDLGRSLNLLTMNALEELDEAFLVATLDVPALHQAKQIVKTLADTGYGKGRLHLVINRMPKKPDLTPQEVEKMLGLGVYATLPDDQPALYDAYCDGKLALPSSHLGRGVSQMARKLAGIEESRRRFSLFG